MKAGLFSLFFFLHFTCNGQINIFNRSLTDSTLKIVYAGVENLIVVEGVYFKINTRILVENADVTVNDNSTLILKPTYGSKNCSLSFFTPHTNADTTKVTFRVDTLSNPIATVTGLSNTTIKQSRLLANPFVNVITPGCYYRHGFIVLSFTATFIRQDSSTIFCIGNGFSKELLDVIRESGSGDKIYFDNIRATCNSCRIRKLLPFWIKIE